VASVRETLPAWFVPEEYDVRLTLDLAPPLFRFEGALALSAELLKDDVKAITLHSKELAYLSCSVARLGGKAQDAVSTTFNAKESTVTFGFAEPLDKGKIVLNIGYIGTHNNQMAGFYRSGYKDAEGNPAVMVSTQFEAIDARRCLPCVDEPSAKAVFKATLVLDEHLTALSNMPEAEVTVLPAAKAGAPRKKRVAFMPSPRMSSYLLAFAVGEFDFLQARTKHGVLVRVFTPPTKAKLGTFALDVATQALDLYDDYFAAPYPLPKLDMIAIPEFAMGAMENWGLVTYREVEVLIAESASAEQKQRVTTVITHELAHQWFGNLVTMAWWDGLWLNEGFASWMQSYAADKIFPEWNVWSQFVVDDQAAALGLDSLASSHPVQVPIRKGEEVEEVFDAISYHKGACVVQLVHAYLGPEAFRNGLRLYMARHAYQNTETKDLWKAWEDAAGGKPVASIMRSWTEQLGFPVLTVGKIEAGDGTLSFSVSQKWFLADGSKPAGIESKVWSVPVLVAYSTGAGSDDIVVSDVDAGMLESAGPKTFTVEAKGIAPGSQQVWVKLNAGQNVPVRVAYDVADVQRLSRAVRSKELDSRDRAGLLLDAYALAKAGTVDPGTLLVLLSAYQSEDNMAVWDAVEQALNGLATLLRGTDMERSLDGFVANLISDRAKALGWDERESDSHLDKLSRAILVRLQAKFMANDPDVKARCAAMLSAFLADPDGNKVPADLKQPVLRVGLQHASRKELEQAIAAVDAVSTIAQKKDLYGALGFTPALADKQHVLEWTTSGAVKLQDFFYPMASVAQSSAQGGELAFEFMREHFGRIRGMLQSASPSLLMGVIAYCAGGFASMERAKEIEEFFVQHPVPLATRKVQQICENTRANAAFVARIRVSCRFALSCASCAWG